MYLEKAYQTLGQFAISARDVVQSRSRAQFQRREGARKNHGLGFCHSHPAFSMFRHQSLAFTPPSSTPLPKLKRKQDRGIFVEMVAVSL